jgi:excisionase family DNA binding protein
MGIPEACIYLGTSRKDIDAAILAGELPANRSGVKGGRWSIKTSDLEKWSDARGRTPRDEAS